MAGEAPALRRRLLAGGVRIGDMLRDPDDRDRPPGHRAVAGVAAGRAQCHLTPNADFVIQADDELLLAGRSTDRRALEGTLFDDAVCEYVLHDRHMPSSWVWRKLARSDKQRPHRAESGCVGRGATRAQLGAPGHRWARPVRRCTVDISGRQLRHRHTGDAVTPPQLCERNPAVYLMKNRVRPYAWGSRTAIATLLGEPVPSSEPQAELWVGAHPADSSVLVGRCGERPLRHAIDEDPDGTLGPQVAREFDGSLPVPAQAAGRGRPAVAAGPPDDGPGPGRLRRGGGGRGAGRTPRSATTRTARTSPN